MLEPVTPERMDLFASRGDFSIMPGSGLSTPRAKAGSESVTRLMNKICVGSRNMLSCKISDVMKMPSTSTMLVESRNNMVFVMFL